MQPIADNGSLSKEEEKIGQFLLAHGGPFYSLQRKVGLLREDEFHAGPRALLLIGIAWGVPLVLSLVAGDAFRRQAGNPYLLDLGVWARFFIAVGLFMLMERRVEEQLRTYLVHFVRAPLLAPGSFESAAEAVTIALKRRDARLAEAVCLTIAILMTIGTFFKLIDSETSSWVVRVSADGNSLTVAGWWCVVISNPLFWFLLLRCLWRLFVWSMLLRQFATLDFRLVASHPDGRGGLAFIGQYPNAYATFVCAMSCVVGAAVAQGRFTGEIAMNTYGVIMGGWLLIVLMLFSLPLFAFCKPLSKLKKQTYLACSALATSHNRAAERELLGRNISAPEDAEQLASKEIPDSSKEFASAQKLSVFLVSKSTLLPISAAALLPLVAAGATELPIKELFKLVKRILFL